MTRREIIQIDEEKCNGCGQCVTGCAEGALAIVNGKARLVSEVYCDGLGACLKECPQDALKIVEREAPEFDEQAVHQHLAGHAQKALIEPLPEPEPLACGCPGSHVRQLTPKAEPAAPAAAGDVPSALRNWPLQLHLAPIRAPFFQEADLLIAADCTGFALTALHRDLLVGKSLIIACPKLDDVSPYVDKLAAIFTNNRIRTITVLTMVVPCCAGLVYLVREALRKSGQTIELKLVQVDPTGRVEANPGRQAA